MQKHTLAVRAIQAYTRQQWVLFALNSKHLTELQRKKLLVGGAV